MPPGPGAFAALGPYAHTRLTVHALSLSLPLDVPGDVFSTQRIDEGTQLLLGHLPAGTPRSLLDLGCGYGALGLPVAARFPAARALLVDRDLLAVAASAHNAAANGLARVTALPGLGYRDLPAGATPFDWLLCNVPARIGPAAIGYLLRAGRGLLSPGGELRVVVIRDLAPVVLERARAAALPVERVADGPRHTVFALRAPTAPEGSETGSSGASGRVGATKGGISAPLDREDHEAIYRRDRTHLALAPGVSLSLERPHDISEDPGHADGLAALLEALPRSQIVPSSSNAAAPSSSARASSSSAPASSSSAPASSSSSPASSSSSPARALVFRCGYGALPLAVRARFPEAQVSAQDRDLLDTCFLRRNAAALGLGGPRLGVVESLFPAAAGAGGEHFDLVLGELSSSAGEAVAQRELSEAASLLSPGGQALVLATGRQRREWFPAILPKGAGAQVLLERGAVCLLRLSRPRA